MKNTSIKGAIGAIALVGAAMAVKKIAARRQFVKGIFDDLEITDRTPLGLADKIRTMSEEDYTALKEKVRSNFGSKCCKKGACHTSKS